MCYFFNGTTQLARLRRNPSSGFLEIRRGTGYGTVLATGAIAVNVGTPVLIEVHYKPHNTEGIFQVKGGASWTSTLPAIPPTAPLRLTPSGWAGTAATMPPAGSTTSCWITPPGRATPRSRASNPPGLDFTQWTPSVGGNYACVDEVPQVRVTSLPQIPLATWTFTPPGIWRAPSGPSNVSRCKPWLKLKGLPVLITCNLRCEPTAPIILVAIKPFRRLQRHCPTYGKQTPPLRPPGRRLRSMPWKSARRR